MSISSLEDIRKRTIIDGECWIWTGAEPGRPRARIDGKTIDIRRLSFEIANGVSDPKLRVISCHNSMCVNPSHLRRPTSDDRLFSMIHKTDTCWVEKRPQIKIEGRSVNIRRLVYQRERSTIPDGMDLLATCRNAKCVNPEHMVLGNDRDRFWSKVMKTDGCWLWTGSCYWDGYGKIHIGGRNGKHVRAHRFAFEEANGEISDGAVVCHACDNPKCVRPDHLFLGTQKENLDDMRRKRRHAHGERSSFATLTEEEVMSIRRERRDGAELAPLANKYRVTISCISAICLGKEWNHLPILDTPGRPRGERSRSAKLTPKQVLEIRSSPLTHHALAKQYGVGHTAIWSIKSKKTWKHI